MAAASRTPRRRSRASWLSSGPQMKARRRRPRSRRCSAIPRAAARLSIITCDCRSSPTVLISTVGMARPASSPGPSHSPSAISSNPSTRPRIPCTARTSSPGFAVEARHQQLLAIRACCRIDAAHQFGEIFAMQIRQHHADGVGATSAEAACRMVRRVLQSLRRGLDPAPHVFGHVAMAVFNARDTVATDTAASRQHL